MTRNDVLSRAIDECIKEFYSIAQPHIEWEDLKEQCEIYAKAYIEWEEYKKAERDNPKLYKEYNERLEWKGKSITECIGPRPYEFYYLPNEIQKDIANSYIHAYKFDNQQELLDTIDILKNYCKEPIVDKWIEGEGDNPGHRGYEHPDNLKQIIANFLNQKYNSLYNFDEECAKELQDKFFEFLDMAGNFYNWNHELNTFNMNVFLGIAPSTNKEKVIDNWKKYRNKDIEIDEKQMKEDYYGEELD